MSLPKERKLFIFGLCLEELSGRFEDTMPNKKYVKICPMCKSTDVRFEASDAGVFDVCKKCGFRMGSFPEIEDKKV